MQPLGETQAMSLPTCRVSLLPHPVPQAPTALPFSWQLMNQRFAQAPFAPGFVTPHAPFGPTYAEA